MDKKKVEKLIADLLKELNLSTSDNIQKNTPKRVTSMFEDIFKDIARDPKEGVNLFKVRMGNQVIIIRNIPFFSFCEDHLLPFFGSVDIAYIPHNGVVTGFSNFFTIVKIISRRLYLQERLTEEIADTIEGILHPVGLMVIVRARHLCVEMRGEKPPNTETITYTKRGNTEGIQFSERIGPLLNINSGN